METSEGKGDLAVTAKCCDPFKSHKKNIVINVTALTTDQLPEEFKNYAEKPMCYHCRQKINNLLENKLIPVEMGDSSVSTEKQETLEHGLPSQSSLEQSTQPNYLQVQQLFSSDTPSEAQMQLCPPEPTEEPGNTATESNQQQASDSEPAKPICCNPFKGHRKDICISLRVLNTDQLPQEYLHFAMKPMCYHCRQKIKDLPTDKPLSVEESSTRSATENQQTSQSDPMQLCTPEQMGDPSNTPLQTEQQQASDAGVTRCTYGMEFNEECSDPNTIVLCSSLPHSECLGLGQSIESSPLPADATVCEQHHEIFVDSSDVKTEKHTKCCEAVLKHYKNVYSSLRIVTPEAAAKYKKKNIDVQAGQYLCVNCRLAAHSKKEDSSPQCSNSSEPTSSTPGEGSQGLNLDPEIIRMECSTAMKTFNLSPLDTSAARSTMRKIEYGKRKITEVEGIVRKKVCLALDIDDNDLSSEMDDKTLALEMKDLMEEIKKKLIHAISAKEKIMLLTLAPLERWTVAFTAEFFAVSRYIIKRARIIRKENGILEYPTYRRGWHILEETKTAVVAFYCTDDNSRAMPGKFDDVSMGRKQSEQRRLILFNLRELYRAFQEENNYETKIGFSMFCSLRPKYCLIAGASGTHNVCVCTKHQNCKLKLKALRLGENMKDIMKVIVYSTENKNCMLNLCLKCKDKEAVMDLLTQKVRNTWIGDSNIEDSEFLESVVSYCEWVSTDRDELITRSCSVSELIETLADSLKTVIPHHFISREQADFLKQKKANLKPEEVIILMDFSMNYSCLLQDASQGHHWNKNAATVHPVVMYHRNPENTETIHTSLCFISDDVIHDVVHVDKTQQKTINYIKENLPQVKEVMYMTDGCAQQYKNCRSFLNLCCHEKRYDLKATWCFFATSHGKSACDGIGGTVKRQAMKASLQRPYKDQITDASKLYRFCKQQLRNQIHFIWLSKIELSVARANSTSIPKPPTIPGTQTFHHFIPLSDTTIGCKRVSSDEEFSLIFSLSDVPEDASWNDNSFVAFLVGRKVHIALITSTNDEEREAELSVLVPPLPSAIFSWPPEVWSYIAPYPHLLCHVKLIEIQNYKYELPLVNVLHIRQLAAARLKKLTQK